MERIGPGGAVGRRFAAISWLAALLLCGCESTESWTFAPIRTSGFIGESLRTRQSGSEPRSYTNQVEASLDVDSYVWQPWFVTVESDLDVAYQTQAGGVTGEGESLLAAGGLALGVFPLSEYPTRLSYFHSDTRVDGEFTGSDIISDRFFFSNRSVISSDLRTSFLASYETTEQPEFGDGELVNVQLGLRKTFDVDRLSVNLSFTDDEFNANESETDIDDQEDMLALATVVYDSVPFDDVTSQSTMTFIYEEQTAEERELDRYSAQGITTAQWRPPDEPYTVNAALRTLSEVIDVGGVDGVSTTRNTETNLLNATLGLNYPIRERLTANVGVNGRAQSIDTEAGGITGEVPSDSVTTAGGSLLGAINYISLPEAIAGFDWRWDTAGSVNLTMESESGFSDAETATLGHSATRTLETGVLSPLRFGANQEVAVRHTSEDGIVPSLFHNFSLSHSSSQQGVATFIRVSASDRRELADDMDEFQLAQIQATRRETIDLASDWLANLSLQLSRQKTGDTDATTQFSANGTISYRVRDLFSVRNLLFSSELTLNAIGLEQILIDVRERDRADFVRSRWRNRLEYRIGRIIASLEGSLFYNREELGNSVFLRVRREFGTPTR